MNKDSPLISVIVPVYRAEKYLPRCLDSLLNQSYQNFELILVDDGSTDDSWNVMREYQQKDPRVRIFHKENGGVSSARNFGLEQAEGTYIAFVDSDDWVLPQYLEMLYKGLQEQHTNMAVCNFFEVEEENEAPFEKPSSLPEKFVTRRITVKNYNLVGPEAGGQCWRMLVKSKILENIRFDQTLQFAEDSCFFTQTFVKAGEFAHIDVPLYCYLKRKASATGQTFSMKQWDEITGWKKILAMVENQSENLQDIAKIKLLIACAHVYYRMRGSTCRDREKERELIKTVREHKRCAFKIPNQWHREKGKVWIMLVCPELGNLIWCTAKKFNIKMK